MSARPILCTVAFACAVLVVGACGSRQHAAVRRPSCATTPSAYWAGEDQNPVWSPDGRTVLFHVASADGSDERTVPAVSPGEDLSPAWSHDSNDVAFVHCRPACDSIFGGIYVASAGGAAVPERISHDGCDAEPAWSPDGRYLAVVHAFGKHRGRWRIDVVDVVSRLRRVFVRCTYQCENPAWSPGGVSLAYLGNYQDGRVTTGPELRVVSAQAAPANRYRSELFVVAERSQARIRASEQR